MVYIEAGAFIMGSDEIDSDKLAEQFGEPKGVYYEDEKPMSKVPLGAYYIDRYEVTNKEYSVFIRLQNRRPPDFWNKVIENRELDDHPVTYVSWHDADAYCRWLGKRLPTEAEWEKAARGTKGRKYPWGDDFDYSLAHFKSGDSMAVGSFKTDKSPYGVYDMGGSVMEWVEDWYKPYEGNTVPSRHYGETSKVLRGGYAGIMGHYSMNKIYARTSYRHFIAPHFSGGDAGFRCAKSENTISY